MTMRGYDDDELDQPVDEYEDYDEYERDEEDGEAQEDEYEEEEDPKPTKEELEYLELRQKLKERIRNKMKKEGGSAQDSSNSKRKLPYDNYGSFFGPSQPVIAQRVIQESKSFLETQHLASRVSNSAHVNKRGLASHTSGAKPGPQGLVHRVRSEAKTKVQKLKDTRDYSFLLSEDAELPAPTKDPPTRNLSVPKTDARPVHVPERSKQSVGNSSRHANGGQGDRKPVSMNGHMHPTSKLTSSKPHAAPADSRKQLGSNIGNGPGRPNGPKVLPSKFSGGSVPKKPSLPARTSSTVVQKPVQSKLPSSNPKQPLEQKKELRELPKAKMLPKQPVASSKTQISKPQRPISSYPTSKDQRPAKKPSRRYSDGEDDDEDGKAISMIRKMFGYNPAKFSGRDEDDSDMEANFDDIMREERRSAKIARKEDEEQLRLIQEEEERERRAKLNRLKKRKLGE